MKNIIPFFTLILLAVVSCKKEETSTLINQSKNQDSLVSVKNLSLDSIKVSDSIKVNKVLTLSYEQSVLIFDDIKDKQILDSMYAPTYLQVKDFSKEGLKKAIALDMKNYFKEGETDFFPYFSQTWDQKSHMKLYSHENDVLTLAYKSSGFSGGAHGYYNEIYKVFDLKNNKSVLLNDVVKNPNDKIWNKILMDGFNKDNADAKDMLLEKIIPLNTNFYFDQNTITFVYNQYEITAYAAGVIYITLNLADIKDQLKPEFLQRIKP